MLAGMFASRGGPAPPAVVQLDAATVLEQALSLSNRSATTTSSLFIGGAKTIYGRKAGKLYFEAVVDVKTTGTSNQALLGVQRTDMSYLVAGKYAYGCGVFISGSTGRVWSDGALQVDLGVPVNGTRYEFAYDLDAKLFWIRKSTGDWNGNPANNPATGVGGFSMSDLASYDVTPGVTSEVIAQQVTFNFDTADFAGSPPSGFIPWPTDTTDDNDGLGNTALNSLRRTSMTLSGSDLVATRTASPAIARSPDYKGEGKFYCEYVATLLNSSGDACGVATFDATATNLVTNGTFCAVAYRSGAVWTDSASRGSIGAIANGDRIDVAIDMDANLIWFRRNGGNWNGSAGADPATGVGGFPLSYDILSPAVSLGGAGANGSSWTANYGSSAFGGTVPDGFVSGWPRKRAPLVQYLWTGAIS